MKHKRIILLVITAVFFFTLLSGCTRQEPSKFENLVTTATFDEDLNPLYPTYRFSPNVDYIYLTGNLKDAEIGATVIAEWYYVGGEEDLWLYQMTLEVTKADMEFYFRLSKPTNNWPLGDYEILLFYNNDLMETVEFEVK
jgi:hypothetical protein